MQASVKNYIRGQVQENDIVGKRVLEVGSFDRNGSIRQFIESLKPVEYIGVDLELGPCVDMICDATEVVDMFGAETFDVVLCTEVVEHVRYWRPTFENLKRVIKPGGCLIITTRSQGFEYHAFPTDYWRYEQEDMKKILGDFTIESLQDDPGPAGVMVKAYKPENNYVENNLQDIALYSIIVGKRVNELTIKHHIFWQIEWFFRRVLGRIFPANKARWTKVV